MASNGNGALDRSPVHLLHRAAQAVEFLFQSKAAATGLTPRQLAVLTIVGEQEGLSQTGLVERTGIDRSTLADMVKRMSKKGLLQRRRTREDARAYAMKLTDEGRKVLRTANPVAKRVDDEIAVALGTRKDAFISGLQGMIAKLQQASR